jgi:polysaccharide export outer membrane protein
MSMRWLLALGLLLGLLQVAAAQSYRVQPGDTLAVSVYEDSNLGREVVVGPDGTFAFPLAGHIQAGGQTLAAIETALKQKLQGNFVEELHVSVGIASLAQPDQIELDEPPTIYVTGEVNGPGAFPLQKSATTNTVQAIALAGGFGPFAATRRILIYRHIGGQEYQFRFNYNDYESGIDLTGNINLLAGDVDVVPEKGLFGF